MSGAPTLRRAVFLDRDGTLMEEVNYCRDPAKVWLLPGVMEGVQQLQGAGWVLVLVTNQSGMGRSLITMAEYQAVHARLLALLPPGCLAGTYFCADHPADASERRKPAPGMLWEAARDLQLDLTRSWMVGDKESDVECGHRAGARSLLVDTGYGSSFPRTKAEARVRNFAEAASFIIADQANPY